MDLYEAFNRGRTAGEERKRQSAISQYFQGATRGDPNALAQVYQADPNAGMQAQKLQQSQQDRETENLLNAAKFYAQRQDPKAWSYIHQKLTSHPQFSGLTQGMPAEINTPEDLQGSVKLAQSLVSAYGGGQGQGVQSRFVDDQGNMVALMRDGTTQVVGKADPRTQLFTGDNGVNIVDMRSATASPVQIGGGAPATQRTMSDVRYQTEDGQPIPPEDMPALMAAMQQDQAGRDFNIPAQPRQLQAPKKQSSGYRPMSQDEMRAAGLPEGTVAQVDSATGKIDVVSKPDARQGVGNVQPLSAGEAAKVRRDFKETKDALNMFRAFDQAVQDTPSLAAALLDGTQRGRLGTAYNNARASLRTLYNTGVLQPGELPMLEQALRDPTSISAAFDPRTRGQLRSQLDELYNTIKRNIDNQVQSYPQIFNQDTYRNEMQRRQPGRSSNSQAPASNGPKRINSAEEYNALPSGAEFIAPDGSHRRKR